jgi:acetoin utilization protein AcuB
LSDRDIRNATSWFFQPNHPLQNCREKLATPVREIQTTDVSMVTPDTGITEIVRLLMEERIGALPVVEAGSKKLVGIVSTVDVLRYLHAHIA